MFWVCQVNLDPRLGGTCRCGGLPCLPPPASHREDFPRATSGLIPPDTSDEPDVFLTLVYFLQDKAKEIVKNTEAKRQWLNQLKHIGTKNKNTTYVIGRKN